MVDAGRSSLFGIFRTSIKKFTTCYRSLLEKMTIGTGRRRISTRILSMNGWRRPPAAMNTWIQRYVVYSISIPIAALFQNAISPRMLRAQDVQADGETPLAADNRDSGRRPRIVMPRITGRIKLDGVSDEPAWDGAQALSFVQIEPASGAAPSERTDVFLAHDDEYLYMAGKLYDREPDKILSNSKQRDSGNPSCEWFGIIIDSFNDKENALSFFTTPSGLRWDATVFGDAQGDSPINTSWNTFWEVATTRNEEGWFAEFRIPLSSLRFQETDGGDVVMGIIVWRKIARRSEWAIFPSIPPDWGFWSKFKPSQAQEFVFKGVSGRRPVYVTPYTLGGFGQTAARDESDAGYQRDESWEHEIGLDLKYGLSSNLTLDMTLNPDFAQVEADDQQVNLTRFSLFFPEKRLFFQERSSVFDFTFETSDQNTLFHSRRIGIHEGRLARIYGGARVVGRIGPYDVGFIDMQTAAAGDLPSENFGVVRLRRQAFNENSYIGGMITGRLGRDGNYNYAYGLDGVIRVVRDEYLTLRLAQTFARGRKNDPLSPAPSRAYVNWLRRSKRGLGYGLSLSYAGADYDPGIGYQSRRNYSRAAASVWHGWYPGAKSPLFNHLAGIDAVAFLRNDDRIVETFCLSPVWRFSTKSGYEAMISPRLNHENVPGAFSLSDRAEVPRGEYRYVDARLELSTPSAKPLYATLTLDQGAFYDGRRLSVSVSPSWSVIADVELGAYYQFVHLRFPSRGQEMTSHITRLRALYTLSTKLATSAFVQYNTMAHNVVGNVRLRYNPREGVDLYLVYDETLNTTLDRESPNLPRSAGRAIMIKYAHTIG
jgi:hypothetical protein